MERNIDIDVTHVHPKFTVQPLQWSSVLRSIQLPLAEFRIEVDDILQECGISKYELEQPHGQIPLSRYLNFLNRITLKANDPLLCIRLAKLIGPEIMGAVGFLFWSSATLYDGLSAICHYQNLFQESSDSYLKKEGDYYAFGYEIYGMEELDTRVDVELSIALHYRLIRLFSNNNIKCAKISFRHSPSVDVSRYNQLFSCPCHFGEERNAVYIKSDLLFTKSSRSDPELANILKNYLDQDLLSKNNVISFTEYVKKIIISSHSETIITAKVIAERLNISVPTLYRRLKKEDTSYKNILTSCNVELARKYLKETTLHVYQISNLLGYSSAAAFTRAFIAWNDGLTPIKYRKSIR
jgi:AraC-like DNA-binding protein|tara:strand:- start:4662 stop:5720 length:1059 start_codon:yes stop_codon:yes gene_type:complete